MNNPMTYIQNGDYLIPDLKLSCLLYTSPATRAGILEKLVSAGFLERKKSRITVQLLPSHDPVSFITVLPEQLQSPLLTAEWEYRLGEIEHGDVYKRQGH